MVKLLTKDSIGASRSVLNRNESENLTVPGPLVKDLVKLCKLLSDETRLKILYYLTQKDELHVRALCELLGESQPAVSHHLALLRVAGLIDAAAKASTTFTACRRSGSRLCSTCSLPQCPRGIAVSASKTMC